MNALSHEGQNKFSHTRSELSSSHVIPPCSPGSGSGRVPQQPSARGGEFSEPGTDSKNILNDLNCHQDVGLGMALQISKFQMKTFFGGVLEVSSSFLIFLTVTLGFSVFYAFSLNVFNLPRTLWALLHTMSVVCSVLGISDLGYLFISQEYLLRFSNILFPAAVASSGSFQGSTQPSSFTLNTKSHLSLVLLCCLTKCL